MALSNQVSQNVGIEGSSIPLHPLVEKRHQIYGTWWGRHMRSDTPFRPIRDNTILVLLFFSLSLSELGIQQCSAFFTLGLFIWTLIEYISHRYTFHELWKVKSLKGLEDIHIPHHFEPYDGINAGPLFYFPLTSVLLTQFTLVCMNFYQGMMITAGMLLGFMWYEYSHYELHLAKRPNRYYRMMKKLHDVHHDVNWKLNFGITSPLWDIVFFTYQKPRE